MHAFLAKHRHRLFPDEMFADLFPSGRGRPSVPADVAATVIVLKRILQVRSALLAVGASSSRTGYKGVVAPEFVDSAEYSSDEVYRWWYERRWGNGPRLCWVGLNPGTGDTDGKPRPTLRKVVTWAKGWGLDGVIVVNLFAFRSTSPKLLRTADVDIVGGRNDEVIRHASSTSARTLAAWGAHGRLVGRGAVVSRMLDSPLCLGLTRHGEPRHPLYVAQATQTEAYTCSGPSIDPSV